jgi:hypothetical protein
MPGQQYIKICTAKQAKEIYRYKTIKTKQYKKMQLSNSTKQ